MSRRRLLIAVALLVAASVGFGSWSYQATQASKSYQAEFVGRASCIDCHAAQAHKFAGSHHDLAMDPATPETVVDPAAFDGREFTHFGVTSKFFRTGDKFFVTTEGEDGKLGTFEVKYVFGVDPLQQYMVEFPDKKKVRSPTGDEVELPSGRIQVLSIAWDTHRGRWFHLYPNHRIAAGDWLHWTGGGQNWNYMCADCHSTNLRKNFDVAANAYHTTYTEIDVSCEACHGPAGEHLTRAQSPLGFNDPRHFHSYALNRLKSADSFQEIQTCAPCHSRRRIVHPDYSHGAKFYDFYEPSTLEGVLYHPDGQIKEELYEYGSFLESRMFRENVRCSNCHDPHSLQPKFTGNALCTQCHTLAKYDAPSHHHHQVGSTGSQCAECHMPRTTYMEVDPRRDHSIRVPRPDLTQKLGSPNACQKCHDALATEKPEHALPLDKAIATVETWFPQSAYRSRPHFGEILERGRRGDPHAAEALADLARNKPQTTADQRAVAVGPVVRASAVALLSAYPDPAGRQALDRALDDDDPLVRTAAVRALVNAPLPELQTLMPKLVQKLDDPIRSVRTEAIRPLARLPASAFQPAQNERWRQVFDEWETARRAAADSAESNADVGQTYYALIVSRGHLTDVATVAGWTAKSEAGYLQALKVDPQFVPAMPALARLYDLVNRDADAERWLRRTLEVVPLLSDAQQQRADFLSDLHYQLGWLLLRDPGQMKIAEAAEHLQKALEYVPENDEAKLQHGMALLGLARFTEAEQTFEALLRRSPNFAQQLHGYAVNAVRGKEFDAARIFLRAVSRAVPQPSRMWRDWDALVGAVGGLQ